MTSEVESTAPARRVETGAGLLMMGLGMLLFSSVDTVAKLLTEDYHPFQIVWTRQLGLIVGAVILLWLHGASLLKTRHPVLQIARGTVAVGSATLFIFALRHVELADAIAVSFVAPFIVTIMGALVLREPVGMRRWIAVCLGFVGTLIVLRPGLGVIHPAAGLVLIAAFFFAIRQIISRFIADTDKTATTVIYTAFVSGAILTAFLPFVWETPEMTHLPLFLFIAIIAAAAEICVIKAFELAMAVVLTPLHYSLMIWGTLAGWLVFGHLPDLWTWVGATIIVATGLYTLRREYVVSRRRG